MPAAVATHQVTYPDEVQELLGALQNAAVSLDLPLLDLDGVGHLVQERPRDRVNPLRHQKQVAVAQ